VTEGACEQNEICTKPIVARAPPPVLRREPPPGGSLIKSAPVCLDAHTKFSHKPVGVDAHTKFSHKPVGEIHESPVFDIGRFVNLPYGQKNANPALVLQTKNRRSAVADHLFYKDFIFQENNP